MQTNIKAIWLHTTKLGRSRYLSAFLGALVFFAVSLMPLGVSLTQAADALGDRVTTEPTGNRAVDAVLTELRFSPLKTTPLSASLALLNGPGGNMTVLAGPAGALLVDTGIHATAESVAKAAEAFAGKPAITVVNTHWHFDHAGGNEWFAQHGAQIIAHDITRARMSHPQPIEMLNFTFPAAPFVALPSITFPDTLTLYHGNETLRLLHVAPTHTDGDVLVYFAAANVLATGDVFFHGFYPHIDYSSRGWIGGMVAAEDRALALCNEKTRVIPGHGSLATVDDLKDTRAMLVTVQGRIETLLDAGKSLDEIVAAAPTADFDETWGHGPETGQEFTRNTTIGIQRHR